AYGNRLMSEQYRPEVTPEPLLTLARGWNERYAPQPAPRVPARLRSAGQPLRIGFLSPDLCRAPVGFFLMGLLRHLDRGAVTSIPSSVPPRLDAIPADLRRNAGLWRDVQAFSDERLLTAIRADGLDILFDLAGHTRGNRLAVFARRAAPLQVSWAGYPGTTGL